MADTNAAWSEVEVSEGPGPTWLLEQLAELMVGEDDVVEVRLRGRTQIVYLSIRVEQVIRRGAGTQEEGKLCT
jgi:hypothetical protein